jgi:hypothetical protein
VRRSDHGVIAGDHGVGMEVRRCEVDTLENRTNSVENQAKGVHDEDRGFPLLAPGEEKEHQKQNDRRANLRGPIDGNSHAKVTQVVELDQRGGKLRAIGCVQDELLRVDIRRTRKGVRHVVHTIRIVIGKVEKYDRGRNKVYMHTSLGRGRTLRIKTMRCGWRFIRCGVGVQNCGRSLEDLRAEVEEEKE